MGSPHKVMIIDNNVLDVIAAERSLKEAGFDVCRLTTPHGAAARVEYEEPDILLVDPSMPRLAVQEVLGTLQREPMLESTLALLFTKGDAAALRERCGVDGYHGFYAKSEPIAAIGAFLREAIATLE